MKQFIENIIAQFGGRLSASETEYAAQQYFKTLLQPFCSEVTTQEFDVARNAMFGSLKIFFGIYYLCLIIYWFHVPAAFYISLVNTIVFIGHFVVYGSWLDPFYNKFRSSNIIGNILPEGTVTRVVIVSAHMDSATEFQWWFQWKQTGLVLTILSGFMLPLFTLFTGFVWLFSQGNHSIGYGDLLYWLFVIFAPFTITMFAIHGDRVVPGAQDNLSGLAVALELARYFSEEKKLQHTQLQIVSFGSEEVGLKGSKYFAEQYPEALKAKTIVVNLDGIKDSKNFHLISKEPMILTKHSKQLNARLSQSFKACDIKVDEQAIPFGGTDATPFSRAGFQATSIVAIDFKTLDPTYHTRLDVPEFVEEKAMEDCSKVLKHFVEKVDEQF